MTSDAKVGLLLGLFFIFVIAFIINGLPRFRSDTNGNELTTMANSPNDSYIGSNERKAQETLRRESPMPVRRVSSNETQQTTSEEDTIRYKRPLTLEDVTIKADQVKTTTDDNAKPVTPAQEVQQTNVNTPNPVKPDLPKIYVVQNGDNLAKIAQKFYGPETGNKTINVKRIYEANRNILKSPDDIQIGQKLIIPLLKDESGSVFSGGLFEKIKSTIGLKPSTTDTPTKTPANLQPHTPAKKQVRYYTVRNGDSLWRIADKQLGDKERFREIIKLNALDDEDYLAVGQRLIIPAK